MGDLLSIASTVSQSNLLFILNWHHQICLFEIAFKAHFIYAGLGPTISGWVVLCELCEAEMGTVHYDKSTKGWSYKSS